MKKLLVVLLSLGLILAFSMTASAATSMKFSGGWYVVGAYHSNPTLSDTEDTYSRAYFYTRTRLQPVFQVAEGLTFTVRMDALEKQWGQTDWRGGTDDKSNSRRQVPVVATPAAQSPKTQENFEFERAFVSFMTAAGQIDVGYQSTGKWATDFGDDENTRPRIILRSAVGPMRFLLGYDKYYDSDTSQRPGYAHEVSKDANNYFAGFVYNFTGGDTGILLRYFDDRSNSAAPLATAYDTKIWAAAPYFKGTFGPVYVEGEFIYIGGKAAEFKNPTTVVQDKDKEGYGGWLYAKAKFGSMYAGGSILYSSGDDGTDRTKDKTGPESPDLNIGLILGRDELQTWENSNGPTGGLGANGNGQVPLTNGAKSNMLMGSLFFGINPDPKTNIEFMVVGAQRDKTPVNIDKNLGIEVDLTASYKIYDNLTYMIGAGWLGSGDYFVGNMPGGQRGNDYLLLNKLTLSF